MKNDRLSKYYYRLAASFIYEDGLERLYMPDGAEEIFKLFPSLCLAIAKLLLNDEELVNTEEAKKILRLRQRWLRRMHRARRVRHSTRKA